MCGEGGLRSWNKKSPVRIAPGDPKKKFSFNENLEPYKLSIDIKYHVGGRKKNPTANRSGAEIITLMFDPVVLKPLLLSFQFPS